MRILADKAISPIARDIFQKAGHEIDIGLEDKTTSGAFILKTGPKALPSTIRERAKEFSGLAILEGQADPQDLAVFSALGLPVLETGNSETGSKADFILWKILEWARKGPELGHELAGIRLGFLQFDSLAEQVAKRAQSFGMELFATEDSQRSNRARSFSCESLPWVDLIVKSDVLLVSPGLSGRELPLIDKDVLRLMPEDALLISLGDLSPYDYEGLRMSLDFSYLRHAVFDLPPSEEPRGQELARFPQCQVYYQEAGHTREAGLANLEDLSRELSLIDQGEAPHLAVNLPKARDSRPSLEVWADLAELIGHFLGQRIERLPRSGEFHASGPGARLGSEFLQAKLFRGLARGLQEENINLISSRPWAQGQEFRLDYHEDPLKAPGFKLTLKTGRGLLSLGALVDDQGPLITEVDGFILQARPQGHILLIPHPNKPGMVGLAGHLLGSHGVNINAMVLAHERDSKDRALMWILLSKTMDPQLLKLLRQEVEMQKAELIHCPSLKDKKGDQHA